MKTKNQKSHHRRRTVLIAAALLGAGGAVLPIRADAAAPQAAPSPTTAGELAGNLLQPTGKPDSWNTGAGNGAKIETMPAEGGDSLRVGMTFSGKPQGAWATLGQKLPLLVNGATYRLRFEVKGLPANGAPLRTILVRVGHPGAPTPAHAVGFAEKEVPLTDDWQTVDMTCKAVNALPGLGAGSGGLVAPLLTVGDEGKPETACGFLLRAVSLAPVDLPRLPYSQTPVGSTLPLGVHLDRVFPGSAADAAGLHSGDWISTFGGKPVRSPDALRLMVRDWHGANGNAPIGRLRGTTVSFPVQSVPRDVQDTLLPDADNLGMELSPAMSDEAYALFRTGRIAQERGQTEPAFNALGQAAAREKRGGRLLAASWLVCQQARCRECDDAAKDAYALYAEAAKLAGGTGDFLLQAEIEWACYRQQEKIDPPGIVAHDHFVRHVDLLRRGGADYYAGCQCLIGSSAPPFNRFPHRTLPVFAGRD